VIFSSLPAQTEKQGRGSRIICDNKRHVSPDRGDAVRDDLPDNGRSKIARPFQKEPGRVSGPGEQIRRGEAKREKYKVRVIEDGGTRREFGGIVVRVGGCGGDELAGWNRNRMGEGKSCVAR